ncbi:MAG: MFS transporter [Ardenticatenaceae bacterium]|nr:MFS transporter [Ardenticatenaceae bacterium]
MPTKRQPKFFYGWVMLGIATVGSMMTTPGQTAGVSLFTPSFEAALGLSRTQQTGAYAMGTFLASLAMTYVGAQMDRFGIRRVMGVVVVLFGIACVYTGFVSGFWTLFIAFLFLRMLGQGSLSLLSQNTVAMWFDRRLGLVQGFVNVGFSLAAAGMPVLVFTLIDRFGWRLTYPILGGIVVAVLLPLILFFYINRPEEINQRRDGAALGAVLSPQEEQAMNGGDFTLAEALRTPAYWIIAGMIFAVSMIVTGVTFNALFFFGDAGLTEGQIATVLATIGLTQAVAQIFAGWLADLISLRWLAFVNMCGQTLAMGILLQVDSMWMAMAYAVTAGLFISLHAGIIGPLFARYYGLSHLGKIRGSIFTATVAGSSGGPFVMGALFDWTGSYTPSIVIFMGIYALFVVLTPFARKPVK